MIAVKLCGFAAASAGCHRCWPSCGISCSCCRSSSVVRQQQQEWTRRWTFPGPDVADARGFLDNIRAFQPLAFSVNVSWEGSLQALARDMHSRAAGPDGWEAALLTKLPCSGGPTLHGCGQLFGTLAVYHSDGKRPPLSLSLSLMMVLGLLRQADRQSCLENRC